MIIFREMGGQSFTKYRTVTNVIGLKRIKCESVIIQYLYELNFSARL